MRQIEAQPGYVLHARPYRETSLLLELFSRDHGRVGVIARGVRGARAQPLRASLQPLQPLLFCASGRGELLRLHTAEAAGPALRLQGDGLLSAFYLNELLTRLLPRDDPQPSLFWRYAEALAELESGAAPAWTLRRFERDLLAGIGYALELTQEADGARALEPMASYHVDPEAGPQRTAPGARGSISGAALLALGEDRQPDAAALTQLRHLMRGILLHHLGGRELRSWHVLAELAAARRR